MRDDTTHAALRGVPQPACPVPEKQMKTAKMKVEYIDHLGTDLTVVNAARVSFDKASQWETGFKMSDDDCDVHYGEPCRLEYTKLSDADVKLIAYLAKHNHWSPFAHTSIQLRVKAPIFVARQLVKHCVTGDTEVTFCKPVAGKSNGRIKRTIADLHRMWTGKVKYQGGKKGKRNVSGGHVKVFNENAQQFESSHIVDVLYQGVKQVFLLTTESGQSVRITNSHKVMTQRGWVTVEELAPGVDYMITEELSGTLVNSEKKRRDYDVADVVARRKHFKSECARCGATEKLECDHIIPVNAGGTHDANNLQTLCCECHKEKSATEKSRHRPNAFHPRWTQVVSIEPAGSEDVYDITVEGWHNFLANGLVVHNCVGGVWNEVSRRYVDSEPEFYFPEVWRGRPTDGAKQGSSGVVERMDGYAGNSSVQAYAHTAASNALKLYNEMLAAGVAPEQARMFLPQGAMTEWYWTGSLMFFARVCAQRLDPHAQAETSEVARQIADVVRPLFPVSWLVLTGKEAV